MSRGIGGVDAIQELIPDWLAVIIAVVTQLGDVWFLVLVLSLVYWSQRRVQDDVAMVGGLFVAGLGTYRAMKEVLKLPRPDEPPLDPDLLPWGIEQLWALTAEASGYGFPSGHATNATVVYVGLAVVLPIGTRRQRLGVAAGLVSVVGVSRVVLGVHYVVDIVAGAALGLAIVGAGLRVLPGLARDRGTPVFALAVATTAVYAAVAPADFRALTLGGIALGLLGGWQLVVMARYLVTVDRPSVFARHLAVRGAIAIFALAPLFVALDWFSLLGGEPYARAGAAGLGAVCVLLVPLARYSPRVRRVLGVGRFYLAAAYRAIRSVGRRWR